MDFLEASPLWCVTGLPGAGKSTLCAALSRASEHIVSLDPSQMQLSVRDNLEGSREHIHHRIESLLEWLAPFSFAHSEANQAVQHMEAFIAQDTTDSSIHLVAQWTAVQEAIQKTRFFMDRGITVLLQSALLIIREHRDLWYDLISSSGSEPSLLFVERDFDELLSVADKRSQQDDPLRRNPEKLKEFSRYATPYNPLEERWVNVLRFKNTNTAPLPIAPDFSSVL